MMFGQPRLLHLTAIAGALMRQHQLQIFILVNVVTELILPVLQLHTLLSLVLVALHILQAVTVLQLPPLIVTLPALLRRQLTVMVVVLLLCSPPTLALDVLHTLQVLVVIGLLLLATSQQTDLTIFTQGLQVTTMQVALLLRPRLDVPLALPIATELLVTM
jgi:hypothetical protein